MSSVAASALLSAPSAKPPAVDPSVPRVTNAHINQSAPFRIRNTDFERQYSHTYAHRLHQMKDRCKRAVQAKWPDVPLAMRTIDLKINKEASIVGTLFKEMKLKPCILDEFQESTIMAGAKPQLTSYVSDDDHLVLEDLTGRVVVEIGNTANIDLTHLVSGIVVGLRGTQESGPFLPRTCASANPLRQDLIQPRVLHHLPLVPHLAPPKAQ